MRPDMRIRTVLGWRNAGEATGHVVVIDVLRAFTTAAYAFAAGIEEIELVATPEEALARPGFRMGEVGGRLISGFDHNNSPSGLVGRRLSGRAVQRTSAGTQGVVGAMRAESLWLGSLVVAGATARALAGVDEVTFVATGAHEGRGDEDVAAADYIAGLLRGQAPPREAIMKRVAVSRDAEFHAGNDPDLPAADIPCCAAIDAFDFAMRVERTDQRLLAHPWRGQPIRADTSVNFG
jgi:2-phosphosulfolactate phosphatase